MSGWLDTAAKPPVQFKPVERGSRKVTEKEFYEQKYKKRGGEFHQFKLEEIGERGIVPSSAFEGYAAGSIVSVIGAPKTGKTQFCIQECAVASYNGFESLYMYNESVRSRFMQIFAKKLKDMKLGENDVKNITFANMHGEIISNASYAAIESYIERFWISRIEQWIMKSKTPRFIVIDSLSKVGRQYIPQLFKVMECMSSGLINVMSNTKKFPVVLIIQQKSGGFFEKYDDSCVGGAGLVHEGDGVMVFKRYDVDRRMSRETGLRWGTKLFSLQIDVRDIDVEPYERVVRIVDGRMEVGGGLFEIDDEYNEKKGIKSGW
jgi:KaiC/GvpD/RAD55 family RecA-like ATPase